MDFFFDNLRTFKVEVLFSLTTHSIRNFLHQCAQPRHPLFTPKQKHPVSSSFGCLLIQYILLICLKFVLLNGLTCYLLLLNRRYNKVKFIAVIFVAVIAL